MFNHLFRHLFDSSEDDLVRDVAAKYAQEDDWTGKDIRGAFTAIGNLAKGVGETEVSQMAREMRDEVDRYIPPEM